MKCELHAPEKLNPCVFSMVNHCTSMNNTGLDNKLLNMFLPITVNMCFGSQQHMFWLNDNKFDRPAVKPKVTQVADRVKRSWQRNNLCTQVEYISGLEIIKKESHAQLNLA